LLLPFGAAVLLVDIPGWLKLWFLALGVFVIPALQLVFL
jgi:hypothetical protein